LDGDLALVGWILLALTVTLGLTLTLGVLALGARRIAIRHPGGTVECSLRLDSEARWQRGVVAYRSGQLAWFRSLHPGLRPDAVFDRQALQVVERRAAGDGTAQARFDTGRPGETVWFQMSPDALTGLLAWLEAGPQPWLGEGVLDHP